MAYKRQIDRLPIIPADAKKHNVTCHYCIVGCGYHAYTWPVNKQGGTDAAANVFGVNLAEQQPAVEVTVDLQERQVRFGDQVVAFDIDEYTRWRLLEGLDDIGLTLRHADAVAAFERSRPEWLPTTRTG